MGRYPLGERAYHFLSIRKKAIIYFLVFLLFSLPMIFSLATGSWLSPTIAAFTVREVLISMVIVTSFYFSWWMFSKATFSSVPLENVIPRIKAWSNTLIRQFYSLRMIDGGIVHTTSNFNEILMQWDAGEVPDARVVDEQILRSLNKSIRQKDETGWLELAELTETSWGGTTSQPALLLLSRELWSIEQLADNQALDEATRECEEKLKSVLPHFAVTPINELLDEWEDGNVSDEDVQDAMLLGSFKKLISDDDETGLYELKAQFPDEKQKHKIRQIAETELWYLNREEIDKSEIMQEEEKLKSLLLAT